MGYGKCELRVSSANTSEATQTGLYGSEARGVQIFCTFHCEGRRRLSTARHRFFATRERDGYCNGKGGTRICVLRAMAARNASALRALLFVACFMRSGRSFVQPALMMPKSTTAAATSWGGGCSVAAQGASSSRATVGRAEQAWRYRCLGMKTTAAGAGGAQGGGRAFFEYEIHLQPNKSPSRAHTLTAARAALMLLRQLAEALGHVTAKANRHNVLIDQELYSFLRS